MPENDPKPPSVEHEHEHEHGEDPAAPATPSGSSGDSVNTTKVWGLAKDVLALLVIPLLLWGVKLEVGNAQRDLLIEQQEKEITKLEARVKDAESIDDGVQANALKLAVLEGKIDTANGRLSEITALLRD